MRKTVITETDRRMLLKIAKSKKLPEWWRPREMGALFRADSRKSKIILRRLIRRKVLEKKTLVSGIFRNKKYSKMVYRLDPAVVENIKLFQGRG